MFRMGRNIARSIHRAITHEDSVDVSEIDGVRSLHLGSDTVQSSMRVKAPYDLELKYTRGMMVFLLFNKQVRNLVMIGLGGGSVPKYIYQYLPKTPNRSRLPRLISSRASIAASIWTISASSGTAPTVGLRARCVLKSCRPMAPCMSPKMPTACRCW